MVPKLRLVVHVLLVVVVASSSTSSSSSSKLVRGRCKLASGTACAISYHGICNRSTRPTGTNGHKHRSRRIR